MRVTDTIPGVPRTLDVRRHAKRSDPTDEHSGLSPEGRAMAEALSGTAPRYALVVATPAPRARETAQLIAGRLDEVVPELLPDLGPVVSYDEYLRLRELSDWVAFVRRSGHARTLAAEQLGVWAGLAARVREDQSVLAASHGGTIEIPAANLAARLGTPFSGPSFGYCEGVRVVFERGEPTALEVLRVP